MKETRNLKKIKKSDLEKLLNTTNDKLDRIQIILENGEPFLFNFKTIKEFNIITLKGV